MSLSRAGVADPDRVDLPARAAATDLLVRWLADAATLKAALGALIARDLRARYTGSFLGALWGVIHPAVTVLLLWWVFEVGLRTRPVADLPFILWLLPGIVPWFFASEAWGGCAPVLREHGYLARRPDFRLSLLPLVKIGSALVIHLGFVALLLIVFGAYGRWPGIHLLQLPYYLGATVLLLLGLGWLSAALTPFLPDLKQVVLMLLQVGFWATPIFWSIEIAPEGLRPVIQANPFCYLVDGYRSTFLGRTWFWEEPGRALAFWLTTAVLVGTGGFIFRRLRPHLGDVL